MIAYSFESMLYNDISGRCSFSSSTDDTIGTDVGDIIFVVKEIFETLYIGTEVGGIINFGTEIIWALSIGTEVECLLLVANDIAGALSLSGADRIQYSGC